MPIRRLLAAVVLVVLGLSTLRAADVVKTLGNKSIEGDLVDVTDKEVSIKTSTGVVKVPLNEVLALELKTVGGVPGSTKYSDIRLLDDTLLHCSKVSFAGKEVRATLLSGQQIKLPLDYLVWVMHDAHDAQLRKDWDAILSAKVKRDRVIILKDDDLNPLPGTFGDVDAKGDSIQFRPEGEKDFLPVKLESARMKGLIFYRTEGPAKSPVCQVYDTQGNSLAAVGVAMKQNTFYVTTAGGLEINYPKDLIARFDYNMGKLTYLSDLQPEKVVEKSGVGLPIPYRKDVNLDGEPILLKDKDFKKGLSLHAHTELEYKLNGKYKEFKAFIGVDPRVGAESKARVTIEADGEKIFNEEVTAASPLKAVVGQLHKARTLRIIVSSTNILDLHDHVTIADAKVTQ